MLRRLNVCFGGVSPMSESGRQEVYYWFFTAAKRHLILCSWPTIKLNQTIRVRLSLHYSLATSRLNEFYCLCGTYTAQGRFNFSKGAGNFGDLNLYAQLTRDLCRRINSSYRLGGICIFVHHHCMLATGSFQGCQYMPNLGTGDVLQI